MYAPNLLFPKLLVLSVALAVKSSTCCLAQYVLTEYACPGNDAGLINDYVRRSGTRFVVQAANGPKDACETFYFAGANAYYMVCLACLVSIAGSGKGLQKRSRMVWLGCACACTCSLPLLGRVQ